MKYKLIFLIFFCIILILPLIQSATTFFDDQNSVFIMVNHSFVKHGLSGVPSPMIVEEVIEAKEITKVTQVVKKVPFYVWLFLIFLFLLWFRRKRCENCRKKFKKKRLTLFENKRYCKECLKEKQKKTSLAEKYN